MSVMSLLRILEWYTINQIAVFYTVRFLQFK
jgi:hypothetical protein